MRGVDPLMRRVVRAVGLPIELASLLHASKHDERNPQRLRYLVGSSPRSSSRTRPFERPCIYPRQHPWHRLLFGGELAVASVQREVPGRASASLFIVGPDDTDFLEHLGGGFIEDECERSLHRFFGVVPDANRQ